MGACRDCKNCTNSAWVHAGRKAIRTTLAIGTYGMTEAVLATRKRCRVCRHQMSLHGAEQVIGLPQPLVEPNEDSEMRLRRWFSRPPAKPLTPAESRPVPQPQPSSDKPAVSVADELLKLAQLRDAGVLTPEELEAQKAKLLG